MIMPKRIEEYDPDNHLKGALKSMGIYTIDALSAINDSVIDYLTRKNNGVTIDLLKASKLLARRLQKFSDKIYILGDNMYDSNAYDKKEFSIFVSNTNQNSVATPTATYYRQPAPTITQEKKN